MYWACYSVDAVFLGGMKTMGHKDVKTAMQYQHPELEIVRAALEIRTLQLNGHSRIELRHTLRHT